jgi:DNA-binding NarL/FixJ family response regulator
MGARHQLAIVVKTPTTLWSGRGWAINRSTRAFTEADGALARALQAVLALLDRIYAQKATPSSDDGQRDDARRRAGLTSRELDMITLVAQGLSAQQIARLRRISVRTVRKDLEHVYDKLKCHDRMLAVNSARRLGLL